MSVLTPDAPRDMAHRERRAALSIRITMNARQQIIMQQVNQQRRVSVSVLAQLCGVSEVTIRQDLNLLEQRSYLRRAHGFALAIDSDDPGTRMMTNFALKQKLAQFAASLVAEGDTLFIESGSSNALLARCLAPRDDVTLITVSAYIAHLLKESRCEVILLGGMFQKASETVVGPMTRQCIQQIHFNKAFIGIDGYSPEHGFTGRDMLRAEVVNAVLAKGMENIIITDSSKFGDTSSCPLGPVSAINRVITDDGIDPAYRRSLAGQNILLHTLAE